MKRCVGSLEYLKAETKRGYYVIRKVENSVRKQQLTWFMERVFLLEKMDYMSRDNFGMIIAAESGINSIGKI